MYACTFYVKKATCVVFFNDSSTFTKLSTYKLATIINSIDTEILVLPWALTKLLTPRPIPFLLQEIRISHIFHYSNLHKPQESVQMSLSL